MNNSCQEQEKDYELPEPPTDSVSALEFVPKTSTWNALCAGSWDNSVRIWEVQSNQVVPKVMKVLGGIPLDISWHHSGTKVFVGDSNGAVVDWDLESNQIIKIGAHQGATRTCHWADQFLMTTSWDKTLIFWDLRTPGTIVKRFLPGRSYAADILDPVAIVASSDGCISAYALDDGGVEKVRMKSAGNKTAQARSLAINKSKDTGNISWFLAKSNGVVYEQSSANRIGTLVIRSNRWEPENGVLNVHTLHDIKINREKNQMATAGSDGVFSIYECNTFKLMKSKKLDQPITKCSYSGDGELFAYALGYDWSKGHEYFDPNKKPQILLRPFEKDVRP
ncbi:protein Rae1 [Drosophila eugracilis]|uniref:protein Rae1 n=1 Tax=Drosophila eugracilis TaxID=29029 RepID=UPI001BDA8F35|nr:protein Rae1 [Drosophila eugracilis]